LTDTAQAVAGARFCASCGTALSHAATAAPQASPIPAAAGPDAPRRRLNRAVLIVAGILIGGLIGFQMRPSVMFVGQLPFQTVITRGAGLRGLDQLLISVAQQSFNIMCVAALIGGAMGFGVGHFLNTRR